MKEYHKIPTVFLRSEESKFKTLMPGAWASPELEMLQNITWIWTEKIDGTNIRVMWDGFRVTFGGKTDNASIPAPLVTKLQALFPAEKFRNVFADAIDICLYGEGYGTKIQKDGSKYIPDGVSFILFDVKIGDIWLSRVNVLDVASKMEIKVVPEIGRGTLLEAVDYVKSGFLSISSEDDDFMAEGLIMKPTIDIFDRKGNRIVAKIKRRDFQV